MGRRGGGVRGGIMKSGSRRLSAGFICSTLAIHNPLEQRPSLPVFPHYTLVAYDNLSLTLCAAAAAASMRR